MQRSQIPFLGDEVVMNAHLSANDEEEARLMDVQRP